MEHKHILDSDRPDKELEFFWITFKNSIREFLSYEEKEEIDSLSQTFNNLQKKEQYGQIEKYIIDHVEKIGFNIIISENLYRACHLQTNIKRWEKLVSKTLLPENSVMYNLLLIFISNKSHRNQTDTRKIIVKLVVEYAKTRDIIHLYKIINIMIEYNVFGGLDKLRNILSLDEFLKDEYKDIEIESIKSRKLLRYFKKVDHYE